MLLSVLTINVNIIEENNKAIEIERWLTSFAVFYRHLDSNRSCKKQEHQKMTNSKKKKTKPRIQSVLERNAN